MKSAIWPPSTEFDNLIFVYQFDHTEAKFSLKAKQSQKMSNTQKWAGTSAIDSQKNVPHWGIIIVRKQKPICCGLCSRFSPQAD